MYISEIEKSQHQYTIDPFMDLLHDSDGDDLHVQRLNLHFVIYDGILYISNLRLTAVTTMTWFIPLTRKTHSSLEYKDILECLRYCM